MAIENGCYEGSAIIDCLLEDGRIKQENIKETFDFSKKLADSKKKKTFLQCSLIVTLK